MNARQYKGVGGHRCVCVCVCGVHVRGMDFKFLLRVAEKRIKAALGKSDAGKMFLLCLF